jgi:hypothetical protein
MMVADFSDNQGWDEGERNRQEAAVGLADQATCRVPFRKSKGSPSLTDAFRYCSKTQ